MCRESGAEAHLEFAAAVAPDVVHGVEMAGGMAGVAAADDALVF